MANFRGQRKHSLIHILPLVGMYNIILMFKSYLYTKKLSAAPVAFLPRDPTQVCPCIVTVQCSYVPVTRYLITGSLINWLHRTSYVATLKSDKENVEKEENVAFICSFITVRVW